MSKYYYGPQSDQADIMADALINADRSRYQDHEFVARVIARKVQTSFPWLGSNYLTRRTILDSLRQTR